MNAVKDFLFNLPLPMWLKVILASMIPMIEARYAILFFTDCRIPFPLLFSLAIIGNMLPVPFIILLFRPMVRYMKNTRFLKPIAEKLESKAEKNALKIKKYETLGLFIFVALPIPGTGAISGSIGAAVLNLRFKYALPAIFLGSIVATAITTGALNLLLTIF